MRVVVAEKPSVARDLARVLGVRGKREGYLEGEGLAITWCHGHMAELEEPAHYDGAWKKWSLDTLPMIPESFALRLRKGAGDQFAVIRRLMSARETVDVVNACDAGREGELIFRYVAEVAACKKPILRLWVSSLTDQAIRQAWSALAPAHQFDRLGAAARCRAEADWLVGLNATRALTCRARATGDLFSVGRVQTPTLAMIVARDRAIAAFVPETYHVVTAGFTSPSGAFTGTFFRPELTQGETDKPPEGDGEAEAAHAERIADRAVAEAIAAATLGQDGRVEEAERKRTRERPPLLYDLTSLQRRANQRYGLSAMRTLEVAQALYERHKLITYPRTDSRYLSPDQVGTLPDILRGLAPVPPYAPFVAALLARPVQPGPRVVNAAEVGDHPAIIPTGLTPPGGLDPDEKRVFDLVARRFMAALSPDALFDVTRLVVAVPASGPLPDGFSPPLRYRARGRVCADPGWRAVDPPGRDVNVDLPPVQQGDAVRADPTEVHDRETRPPRPYNDASVLHAMETAGKALDDESLARALRGRGLGTPATRASILQTLLDRQYIERRGRELHATARGCALIDAVPVPALKSAELTADWEGRLSDMADGKGQARPAFLAEVAQYTRDLVDQIVAAPAPALSPSDAPALGPCPKCGQPVRARGLRFLCDQGDFEVYSKIAGRPISPRAMGVLLKTGQTAELKGFRSKAGKAFSAGLRWDAAQGKVVFWFPTDGARERPAPRAPGVGDACPRCGEGRLIQGKTAIGCDRWREGCEYRAEAAAPPPARPAPPKRAAARRGPRRTSGG